MPTLPDFTQLGERPTPSLPRRSPNIATARATSGMEGVAAQEMTQTAAHLDAASRIAFQIQDEHDTLRAEDAFNQLRQRQIDMTYGDSGYMKLQGANAVNQPVLKNYGDEFDKTATDLAGSLDNDFQRKLFEKRAGIAGLDLRQGIVRHVSQQSDVYAQNVLKGTIDTEVNASAADPSITKFSLARIDNSIDNYASRLGLPKEVVDSQKAAAKSHIYSSQIKTALINDPLTAQKYYNLHVDDLSPADRPILEHAIKAAVTPIYAKTDAEGAVSEALKSVAPSAVAPTVTREELLRIKDDKERAQALDAFDNGGTSRGIKATLGTALANGARLAAERRPDDPIYRDTVEQNIKGYYNNIITAQVAVESQAHSQLISAIMKDSPTTPQELLAKPENRKAFDTMTPETQLAITTAVYNNARRDLTTTNKGLFADARRRLYLPEDDPSRISSWTQLTKLMAPGSNGQPGISVTDLEKLRKEFDLVQDPNARPFQQRVQETRQRVQSMLGRTMEGQLDPGAAQDAFWKWDDELNKRIVQIQKDGGNPSSLLTPGTKDSMVSSEMVKSFLPDANVTLTTEANKARKAEGQYTIGQVYDFKQGAATYQGGDPSKATSWKPAPKSKSITIKDVRGE